MNDIEAAEILEHALKFDQFPHVQQALEHAAKVLRERAAAEPVAYISNASRSCRRTPVRRLTPNA